MFLKDIIYPKTCLSCSFLGSYICLRCQRELRKVEQNTCLYCHRASYAGLTHVGCQRDDGVDGFIAVFHYNPVLKRIIKQIKYRLVSEGLKDFLTIVEPQSIDKLIFYRSTFPSLVLQPIPLHKMRLRARGFNQSEIISTYISKIFSLPQVQLIDRIKATNSQAGLSDRKQRFLNMKSAFRIKETILKDDLPLSIMLIDDVVTSGSTVKEAAKVLKKFGIKKVFVTAIAKG